MLQDGGHLLRDGHLHVVGLGSPSAAEVVRTPSATLPCSCARTAGSLCPRPSSTPTDRLRESGTGAGEHQVPQAGKSGQRFPAASASHRQAGDLGDSAGDDGRRAVVPQAQAGGDAGGNRDDVLERATQFHADHIIIGIDPQAGRAEFLLQPVGDRAFGGGDGDRRGIAGRYFLGERGSARAAPAYGRLPEPAR